jgi:hypothetical protein
VLNPQNYPINPGDVGWTGLTSVAQGGQPSFAQIAGGGSVNWNSGAGVTTASATALANQSVSLDSGQYTTYSSYSYRQGWGTRTSNNYTVYVDAADYRNTFGTNSINAVRGLEITGNYIQSGTTISSGSINSSGSYGYFTLSKPMTNTGFNNRQVAAAPFTSNAWTINFNTSTENRNFVYVTKASFNATGAVNGTEVSSGSTITFPANTLINRIELEDFAGVEYYKITFNNTYSGTFNANTSTVTFRFIEPPYAQPGETVFSFIANPGERSTLDLSELKELTNTPLGGRGTYPNGPDVLAINVYKISGSSINSNIVLKWGEAQA